MPEINLPYQLELRDYQRPVWDHMMKDEQGLRALTVWSRRSGKDLIALNILIAKAIQKPGLYLYIGPLHTQTRQIVWLGGTNEGKPFLDFIPKELIKKKRNAVMEIELINGSLIKLVGSDQYDNLMGLNCRGAVFTEYSLQKPEAYRYIAPMLSANGGWAVFNGTPRGLNHMYTLYQMATKNDAWFCQYLTRDDTGVPTLAAIEEDRKSGMKESLIEQEYYCSWDSSSEDVFIPLDYIAPTIKPEAELQPADYKNQPRIFGCDVAYAAKGDMATIVFRQGRKIHFARGYTGYDNMAFADEIARFIKKHRPHIVNVDGGRGEGVISRLFQLGFDSIVREVHFGGKVFEEGITNRKAQMWLRMLEWFNADLIPDMTGLDDSPDANMDVEEQLVRELSTPFMLLDEKNQVRVEPKSSLKQRGQSSPDLAEALGLTFAEEVELDELPDHRLEEMGITSDMMASMRLMSQQNDYDPLNHVDSLMNGSAQSEEEQYVYG